MAHIHYHEHYTTLSGTNLLRALLKSALFSFLNKSPNTMHTLNTPICNIDFSFKTGQLAFASCFFIACPLQFIHHRISSNHYDRTILLTFSFHFINTGIIATVTGPNTSTSPNCCAFATGNFPVDLCDLLSVRITITGSGALENGAAATILFAT